VPAEELKARETKGSKGRVNSPAGSRNGASVMIPPEVCAYLRIHRSTLFRLIEAGKIPHFRIGSDYRFNREMIEAWMRDRG
jgi:excisionase family DNA binding protein